MSEIYRVHYVEYGVWENGKKYWGKGKQCYETPSKTKAIEICDALERSGGVWQDAFCGAVYFNRSALNGIDFNSKS